MLRRVRGGMPLRALWGVEGEAVVLAGLVGEVEEPVTSS